MRLFTGFATGDDFVRAASDLGRSNGRIEGLRWVPGINLHVTACFIGEVARERLPFIQSDTAAICAGYKPISLNLKEICIWPKRKPYMVWALYEEHPDFTAIYRQLERKLTGTAGGGPVLPHVTLARFKEYTDTRQIRLNDSIFPEHLVCDRLILFESRLAPEGPTYYSLGEYLLGQ